MNKPPSRRKKVIPGASAEPKPATDSAKENNSGQDNPASTTIRDFQEINYSIKIKSPHLNNNDNHFKGVRGGCRRQPPLTPLNIHEKLCTL